SSLGSRLVFKYAEGFSRPVNFAAGNIPAETACAAQFLGFGQVSFAASQLLFRLRCGSDIHYRSNKLDDSCFVLCFMGRNTDMLDRIARQQQAAFGMTILTAAGRPIDLLLN